MKDYFKNELTNLKAINNVDKTVDINGRQEMRNLSNVDLSKELSAFSDADINRMAWIDKYDVDSIHNDAGELLELRYAANDEDMKTQSLLISFQNKSVERIFIKNQVDGFATWNTKGMTYISGVSYSIKSNQQTLIGAEQSIDVDVKFVK